MITALLLFFSFFLNLILLIFVSLAELLSYGDAKKPLLVAKQWVHARVHTQFPSTKLHSVFGWPKITVKGTSPQCLTMGLNSKPCAHKASFLAILQCLDLLIIVYFFIPLRKCSTQNVRLSPPPTTNYSSSSSL